MHYMHGLVDIVSLVAVCKDYSTAQIFMSFEFAYFLFIECMC